MSRTSSDTGLVFVRAHALSLPGVTEQDHFGRPSFRIGKKIFMTLWPVERRAVLMFTPDQQAEHVPALAMADDPDADTDPRPFFPVHGTWGMRGATFMALDGEGKPKVAVMGSAIELAWRNIAGKRLVEEFVERRKS